MIKTMRKTTKVNNFLTLFKETADRLKAEFPGKIKDQKNKLKEFIRAEFKKLYLKVVFLSMRYRNEKFHYKIYSVPIPRKAIYPMGFPMAAF